MKFVCALLLGIASLARSVEEETEEEYLNRRRLILPAAAGAASWAALQELVGLTASGAVISNFAMSGSHGVNLRIENHLCTYVYFVFVLSRFYVFESQTVRRSTGAETLTLCTERCTIGAATFSPTQCAK